PRATRAIRAETAGSSSLALRPNQRGKAGGEVEASIPVMAMAHQRTRGKVPRRTWPNLAATPLDQGDAGATGRVSRFSLARESFRPTRTRRRHRRHEVDREMLCRGLGRYGRGTDSIIVPATP